MFEHYYLIRWCCHKKKGATNKYEKENCCQWCSMPICSLTSSSSYFKCWWYSSYFHIVDDSSLFIPVCKEIHACCDNNSHHSFSASYWLFAAASSFVFLPSNVSDALSQLKWKEAMCKEIRAFRKNCIQELVTIFKGKQPVWCKYFTVKYKADGSI